MLDAFCQSFTFVLLFIPPRFIFKLFTFSFHSIKNASNNFIASSLQLQNLFLLLLLLFILAEGSFSLEGLGGFIVVFIIIVKSKLSVFENL